MDAFYQKPNKIVSCFERFRASHVRVYMNTGNPFTLPNRIIGCSLTNSESNEDLPTNDEMDAFVKDSRIIHIAGLGTFLKIQSIQTVDVINPTIVKIDY